MTAACENKKWKSAVAEADCLSAELRLVREELWEKAEESAAPKRSFSFRTCASFGARSFGIAMAIVCLCTFPIAVESGRPQNIAALPTGAENKFEEFTLVTAEEKELLQMLRANLKESNEAVRTAEKEAQSAKRSTAFSHLYAVQAKQQGEGMRARKYRKHTAPTRERTMRIYGNKKVCKCRR